MYYHYFIRTIFLSGTAATPICVWAGDSGAMVHMISNPTRSYKLAR